jgi:hypothetical protein
MLAIGVRPFVEFVFCPVNLATKKETVFWRKGNGIPPKDYARWGELIDRITTSTVSKSTSVSCLIPHGSQLQCRLPSYCADPDYQGITSGQPIRGNQIALAKIAISQVHGYTSAGDSSKNSSMSICWS